MRACLLVALGLLGCQSGPAADPAREAVSELGALDPLDATSRDAVLSAPVPVLLLPDEWAPASRVMAGRGYYAVSAREGELSVSLHATDIAHAPADGMQVPAREHTVRGQPALVMVNDAIRSVTWEEGRTSYVLEVECYRALEDPRCTEDAYVLELAESLVPVTQ